MAHVGNPVRFNEALRGFHGSGPRTLGTWALGFREGLGCGFRDLAGEAYGCLRGAY